MATEAKIVGFTSKSNVPKFKLTDFPWWLTEAAEWTPNPDDDLGHLISLKPGWKLEEGGFPVRISED